MWAKRTILLFIALGWVHLCLAQQEQVLFSSPGGFYNESFEITLECLYANHHIRFTTNGNTPTAESRLYEGPLTLNGQLYSNSDIYTIQISPNSLVYVPDSVRHAIVIRAAVFDENDNRISNTATNTYLIEIENPFVRPLPVMSICADSLALFDYETGIFVPGIFFNPDDPNHTGNYYQKGRDWEREVNVEFYEPNNSGINQVCGLRTHGNMSRRFPAKGMKIYAREEYGHKRFNHDFFHDSITSFKHLVIKPFAVFDPHLGSQDYFCTTLAHQLDVAAPSIRPILLYLNGEYWGVYFLQEKMDERYLEDHFDVDPDNCNIIGNWCGEVECGDNASFFQMMSWFSNADLTDDMVYEQACNIIDIPNFIDYYILETFIGNWDWPGNNMRCWQENDGLWRWLFFDGDATLINSTSNAFPNAAIFTPPQAWGNHPEDKLVFGQLLMNEQFRTAFSARATELCGGVFQDDNTLSTFNEIVEILRPRIGNQRERFGYPVSDDSWNHWNSVVENHLRHRNQHYLSAMDQFFTYVGIKEYPDVPRLSDIGEFLVYDMKGILVARNTIPSKLAAGIYIIVSGNTTQRIIIQ